jgi:predicted GIY-YIG superfamily endonuclease
MTDLDPGRTALYRLYDSTDQLLYVGITGDPKVRWAQHAADKTWWPEVSRRDVEWVATRAEAEGAEREAIATEKPTHNTKYALPELSEEETAVLFGQYKEAYETERKLRPVVRAAAATELRAGATASQLARRTGLTAEVFRRIARELDLPVDPRYADRAEASRKKPTT